MPDKNKKETKPTIQKCISELVVNRAIKITGYPLALFFAYSEAEYRELLTQLKPYVSNENNLTNAMIPGNWAGRHLRLGIKPKTLFIHDVEISGISIITIKMEKYIASITENKNIKSDELQGNHLLSNFLMPLIRTLSHEVCHFCLGISGQTGYNPNREQEPMAYMLGELTSIAFNQFFKRNPCYLKLFIKE